MKNEPITSKTKMCRAKKSGPIKNERAERLREKKVSSRKIQANQNAIMVLADNLKKWYTTKTKHAKAKQRANRARTLVSANE